jgi:glycerol-3-phosphate acyltransferase PlsY
LTLYAVLFFAVIAVELARFAVPALNEFLCGHFSGFIRPNERNSLTGTAPYVLGIGSTLSFYRTDIAAAAICFLAVGDVAATTTGERWGRTKVGEKSLEGTLAFAVSAMAAGLLLSAAGFTLMPGLILAGAITAAGVELIPLPVNDNLSIPLVSGGVMELIARLTGCV